MTHFSLFFLCLFNNFFQLFNRTSEMMSRDLTMIHSSCTNMWLKMMRKRKEERKRRERERRRRKLEKKGKQKAKGDEGEEGVGEAEEAEETEEEAPLAPHPVVFVLSMYQEGCSKIAATYLEDFVVDAGLNKYVGSAGGGVHTREEAGKILFEF